MTELEAALRDMLGPSVAVALTDPRAPEQGLFQEETAAIAQAVPKRRREFAAGRRAARAAMAKLGRPAQAVPMGPDRAPVWPQGIMGSIAHCDTVCMAALIDVTGEAQSVGLDVEPAVPLSPDLEHMICTETERGWLNTMPQEDRGLHAKQIFCAKEAFYKAQYPLTLKTLTFQDVTLESRLKQGLYIAKSHNKHPIHLREVAGFCVAACLFEATGTSL
jgi:4'-phosphopantetheinyl transferase EntD